ncbi:hypothetical protein IFT80_19615 [Pseudomonas sp. CFBP 8771]|uniref:Rap1a/Tai family immunity protein n=1 Tax=Pseudomonas sp. CFBP 8771 TaxID=2775285 RepID=UPI001781B7F2|nr:Rap1a/Tai family immunity protein [Pseudomonas sp. CFBP 8771]MBD8604852.1 hypothetical protein [Pseudomonas sp. CFBP 8771]
MKVEMAAVALSLAICTFTVAHADTGNEMLNNCRAFLKDPPPSSQMFHAGVCAGFVIGIVDGLMFAQVADPSTTAVCMPERGYTVGQGIRVLTKYLNDHPEKLNVDVSLLAFEAFRRAFPCK